MTERLTTRRGPDEQSRLLAKIGMAVESKTIRFNYTRAIDLVDKRTRIEEGQLANHGAPYREDPKRPVEYTTEMELAHPYDNADPAARVAA